MNKHAKEHARSPRDVKGGLNFFLGNFRGTRAYGALGVVLDMNRASISPGMENSYERSFGEGGRRIEGRRSCVTMGPRRHGGTS